MRDITHSTYISMFLSKKAGIPLGRLFILAIFEPRNTVPYVFCEVVLMTLAQGYPYL